VDILPAPIERAVHAVPVRIHNLGPRLRASADPPNVTVILRGSRQSLGSLDAARFEAWVDAESLDPGRYALPIKIDTGPDFGVVRVEPAVAQVRIR
jgi:YbbR domain-containing protein